MRVADGGPAAYVTRRMTVGSGVWQQAGPPSTESGLVPCGEAGQARSSPLEWLPISPVEKALTVPDHGLFQEPGGTVVTVPPWRGAARESFKHYLVYVVLSSAALTCHGCLSPEGR